MKRYLFIFVIVIFCGQVTAQNGVAKLIHKGLELIDSMSVSGVDRRYIDAPEKPWQLILRGNVNQSSYRYTTIKRGFLRFKIDGEDGTR